MIAKPLPVLEEIQKAVRIIIGQNGRGRVVEVRAFDPANGTWSGYYTNGTLSQDAFDLNLRESIPNLYWTIQELNKELLVIGQENTLTSHVIKTTDDPQVKRYLYLPIDCDPIRPKDTSSTDAEKAAALAVALRIIGYFRSQGIECILADSGNGYHVLVPLDIPNVNGTNLMIAKVLKAINATFGTEAVGIDEKVFNPSRILKIYGTVARKGEHTDERPWRLSRLVDVPANLVPLNEERLTALLADLTNDLPQEKVAEISENKRYTTPAPGTKITETRNNALASYALHVWYHMAEPNVEELRGRVYQFNQEFLEPPLDESEIDRTVMSSTPKKPQARPVLSGGVPVGEKPHVQPAAGSTKWEDVKTPEQAQVKLAEVKAREHEEAQKITDDLNLDPGAYPKFPDWVMKGTSIYDGLVKPICDVNCRHEEAQFMPAVVLILNYLGTKVRIERKKFTASLFLVMIGDAGRYLKSACVDSAIEYLETAGIVGNALLSDSNANGRALVWTAGSPEGLGKEMNRLNCRNSILFYDELANLVSKASIDSSTLRSALCTMYESGKMANTVKNPKDSYNLPSGQYCSSLIACCPTENFTDLWGKLNGKGTGLDSRTFFLMQPEVVKEKTPYVHVTTTPASVTTLQLIQQAVTRGTYAIYDQGPLAEIMKRKENPFEIREEARAEKFALFFAIDRGLDEINEDCVERGIALVEYEKQVKLYNPVSTSETKEGAVQSKIVDELERAGGVMLLRDLEQKLHPIRRWGTTLWSYSLKGLITSGVIQKEGTGQKGDPIKLRLLRKETR
jgi:hypothetical protein